MREGWKVCSLGEIANIGAGNSAPQKESLFENGTHPFVRTSDVGQIRFGSISDSRDKLNCQGLAGLRLVPKGSILLPKSGASTFLNHRVILGRDSYVSSHLATVKAIPVHALDRYLLYYLSTIKAQDIIQDHKYPSLKLSDIKNIKVLFPPLPEQKRIVAILDEAFAGIDKAVANTEKNLANARELFENIVVNRIFGDPDAKSWSISLVKDIVRPEKNSIRTGPFGSQLLHGEFVDDGISVLGIDNVVNNKFLWGKRRYITVKKYHELERYTIKTYDVLISIMGTCGRCAVVPENIPLAINTKHLCCISLDKNKCIPDFLHSYFLYHPIARNYLKSKSKGSIMSGLNMGIIKELPVRLPRLQEQRSIISSIKRLSNQSQQLETIYKQKLTALAELKQSLLKKAFSGELTPKSINELEKAAA